MSLRWATLAILVASTAAGTARAQTRPEPLQVLHRVTAENGGYRLEAGGRARLPDGAVVHVRLLPVEETGKTGSPLRTHNVEVKGGSFTVAPWSLKSSELLTLRYRLEAEPVTNQPPAVFRRMPRGYRAWSASSDLILGGRRGRCEKTAPVAKVLLERMAEITAYRDRMMAVVKQIQAGKAQAGALKAWGRSSGFNRVKTRCAQVLAEPLAAALFPRATARGRTILNEYDVLLGLIEGGEGFWTEYFSETPTPPPPLLDFEKVLAVEGQFLFVGTLNDLAGALVPKTGEPERAAVGQVAKGLPDLLRWTQAFHALPWESDLTQVRLNLTEAIDATRLLVEHLRGAPSDDAGRARTRLLQTDVRTRLDALRNTLLASL